MPSNRPPDDEFRFEVRHLSVRLSRRASVLAAVVLALVIAGHLLGTRSETLMDDTRPCTAGFEP